MTAMTRRRRGADERGSITIWLALSSFVMVFLVGLAVDLGGQVHTQQRGHDLAAQAARAGGEELQASRAIQGRALAIDAATARAAAQRYLAAAGVHGTARVTGGDTLTVTVRDTYQTKFLGLIGITHLDVTSTASAHLVRALGGHPR